MTFPEVAVVIPTFNRRPLVCEAVNSVLAQTYPEVECVVVDDGSTDRTGEFLAREYRDRIRLLTRTKNGEKSAARNDGIRSTQAAFVCMLDSDDLLTPESVEARMRMFFDDPGFDGVVYGPVLRDPDRVQARPDSGHWPEGDVLEAYLKNNFIHNQAFLLSTANMLRYGMYREDMTHREDVELLIRLACRLQFRCCEVPVARLRHVDRSSRCDFRKYLQQGDRLVGHLRSDPHVAKRLGSRIVDIEFSEARELARAWYRTGDYQNFRRSYLHLCWLWPERMLTEGRFLRRFLVSLVRG
jgi:glycosyltransferase involved in cell wall biosynthesis